MRSPVRPPLCSSRIDCLGKCSASSGLGRRCSDDRLNLEDIMVKIFGREPAVWIGVIEGFLALLLSWDEVGDAFDLTNERVGAIMAVVVAGLALYVAAVTSDTMLGVVVGLGKAVL